MRWIATVLLFSTVCLAQAPDPRLGHFRSLHEGSNFTPPATKEAWLPRAEYIREQVLLAGGLYPLPEKMPLNAVIHTPIDRGDYTVEHVFFESYPGFFVSGNLYRPKGKQGPFPAVLSPHGHWGEPAGRFYRAGEREVEKQLKGGWETEADAARYPLQARCANLAKLGCIVFQYDMVGYADADRHHFPHRSTFTNFESAQWGLSIFGLQSWDSIRAIDFVLSLPDVDPTRIACTGASGGGTQTFILMNTDRRLTLAAPVCMISAGEHQGGCVCENSYYLRLGTDNVEFAATFAPKPLVHPTATGDWTAHFLEQGYPQLKAVYRLFGAEDNVLSERYSAEHNYNKKSRELVYNFINQHFKLGAPTPVVERKFTPVPIKELSVFTVDHPRPARAVTQDQLKSYLIKQDQSQQYTPEVLATALRHMMATNLPTPPVERLQSLSKPQSITVVAYPGEQIALPIDGKQVLSVSFTRYPAPPSNIEFFTGYNRTVLANRVNDILATIAAAQKLADGGRVNLIGVGEAGPWCLLAAALAGDKLHRVVIDANHFDFDQVKSESDANFQPMMLRYGGLYAFVPLISSEVTLCKLPASAKISPSARVHIQAEGDVNSAIQWLLKD